MRLLFSIMFITLLGSVSLPGAVSAVWAGAPPVNFVEPLNSASATPADARLTGTGNGDQVNFYGVVTEDDLEGLPTEGLVPLLGHELPWTRLAAARVLAEEGLENVPIFLNLLGEKDWRLVRAAQDGLHIVLRQAKDDSSDTEKAVRKAVVAGVPALTKNLRNEHYYVRMGALQCLGALGADAAPAGDEICALAADEDYLGVAPMVLRTIRTIGASNFDSEHLFAAIEESVKNPNIGVRKAAIDLIQTLDEAEQRKLVPAMLYALDNQLIDGFTRFHVQAQIARLLHKLGAEGTLPRIVAILEIRGWGEAHRVNQLMPLLAKYGPEAAEFLPFLEEFLDRIKGRKELVAQTQKAIEAISKNAENGGGAQ